jgi:biopolymer transport protein ExbD
MRKIRDIHRGPGGLSFNATPLVDVMFTLTIFFSLVGRFSAIERAPLELPNPPDSQAQITRMPDRVVVNCRLADPAQPDERGVLYSLGPNQPEPLGVISDRLAALKQTAPEVKVVVRADRRLDYADVRAVMQVVARNGIEVLNVVAHVAEQP